MATHNVGSSVRATELLVNLSAAHLVAMAIKAEQPDNRNLHNALDKALQAIDPDYPHGPRAFELRGDALHVQSSRPESAWLHYDCTLDACECVAWEERGLWCWHRGLLLMLLTMQRLTGTLAVATHATAAKAATIAPAPRRAYRRQTVAKPRVDWTPRPRPNLSDEQYADVVRLADDLYA
jgi:hypothetical protein